MDTELVISKLDSLARCIERLRSKTPERLDVLQKDMDVQDIVAVNLERAVQVCVDIALHWTATQSQCPVPETMAESFQVMANQHALPEPIAQDLISAVGFRNLSVHAYDKINWEIVWNILNKHIEVFPKFASHITILLKENS